MVEQSALKSFIEYDENHHFPLENIPFGTFIGKDKQIHCCTRIGDYIIDLAVIESKGLFNGEHFSALQKKDIFSQPYLNDFMSLGKPYWHEARVTIQNLFKHHEDKTLVQDAMLPHGEV